MSLQNRGKKIQQGPDTGPERWIYYSLKPHEKWTQWNVLQDAWRTLPEENLETLEESSPGRVEPVLKNKGSWTKYLTTACYSVFDACVSISTALVSCFLAK